MGYRELLKKYMLHLQLTAGDHYIDSANPEPVLNDRDLGELRALAAEINRGAYDAEERTRLENCNARLRVLMNQHALTPERLAEISGVEQEVIRRWRISPQAASYVPMSEEEFLMIQRALERWLESIPR